MAMLIGYIELLLATTDEDKTHRTLNSMMHILNRSTGTVSKLIVFENKAMNRSEWFCLATLLNEEYKLLMASFDTIKLTLHPINGYNSFILNRKNKPDSAHKEHDICSTRYGVVGDRAALAQVLSILCINANQHAFSNHPKPQIQFSLERMKNNKNLRLKISDNGCGISPEVMDRIFDPYFTTESEAESSGLGLFMVQGIVNNAGGHIECESELSKGTTFTITLPITDKCNTPQPGCSGYCVNAVRA